MKAYPNVLVLGDGLLGSHIISQTGWEYLSQDKNNIDVVEDFEGLMYIIDEINPDLIVNCIGYTNTYDEERQKHWELNYEFVVNLVDFCDSRDYGLVHISTDYIYANSTKGFAETDIPVHQETWYSYCKLISDAYVQLSMKDNFVDRLLIRCSLKPTPFPYEKAFVNVRGTFDYVDTIAEQIIELIREGRTGVWNIGTPSKTMFELAQQTRPDVKESVSAKLPSIELNLSKFRDRK